MTSTHPAVANSPRLRFVRLCLIATAGALSVVLAIGCTSADRMTREAADLVIEKLTVGAGARVADIGAGDGAMAARLADAIGATGKVYAAEIAEPQLRELRLRATQAVNRNFEVVVAAERDAKLPEPVDLVVMRHVYHHLEDRVTYFRGVRRYLRSGGRIAIIELDRLPWYYFHGRHQTSAATIKSEMAAAGYACVGEYDDLAYERMLTFVPRN